MTNTKPYNDKLPKVIREGINNFAGSECILVKQKLDTEFSKSLNCHYNVRDYVKLAGGEQVNGWLLNRKSSYINEGIWHWSYHSLWKKSDTEYFDITKDKNNSREFSTFVPDTGRIVNLTDGVSFNDILILEHKHLTDQFNEVYDFNVKEGVAYWVLSNFTRIRNTTEYDGQYRFIRPEFPNNTIELENRYKVTVVDGKLKHMEGNDDAEVNANMLFEFNVSSN
jgi:hypothetical protein